MSTLQTDPQPQNPEPSAAYEHALTKIAQLEEELLQKETVLSINIHEQVVLRERLRACIQTIQETTTQLVNVEHNIKDEYRHFHHQIEELRHEIRQLESSNDVWSNRSIKLEFEILTAQETLKSCKADLERATQRIAQLEAELQAAHSENAQLRQIIPKNG
jgi:chromosome segregation ATPase